MLGVPHTSWAPGAICLFLFGCSADVEAGPEPSTASPELPIALETAPSDDVHVSHAVGLSDCRIAVGANGRVLVSSPRDSSAELSVAFPPGTGSLFLDVTTGGSLIAWQRKRSGAWLLDLSGAEGPETITRPRHPWGGEGVGQILELPSGRLVFPTMTAGLPRRNPEPWPPTPAVQVLDPTTGKQWSVGKVADRGGRYLSWYGAHSSLGIVGDTILWIGMFDGLVRAAVSGPDGVEQLGGTALPRTFPELGLEEDVWDADWMAFGDEVHRIHGVPQILHAEVSHGRIYLVRNHSTREIHFPTIFFDRDDILVGASRVLDVFDLSGSLLGSFQVPSRDIHGVDVDGHGRIILTMASGVLLIAVDPFHPSPRCTVEAARSGLPASLQEGLISER